MNLRVALIPGTSLDDPTYARALPALAAALRRRGWLARPVSLSGRDAPPREPRPALINLHCSGRLSPACAAALERWPDAPLVLTFQDLDHPDLPAPGRAETARLAAAAARARRLVALTPALAGAVRRRFPGRGVISIGNGVEPFWFGADGARRGPMVACARLAPYKGIDVLLWSFAGLVRERPEARLRVYGRDFQRGHYQRLARRLGLADKVRFAGHAGASRLRRALSQARLFVSPSRRETYGMAVLEAMAAGAPVVATCTGASPELMRHARSGWLVPPEDPSALEAALRRLWDDGPLRRRLGARARMAARAHSWDERAARYDRVFREALDER